MKPSREIRDLVLGYWRDFESPDREGLVELTSLFEGTVVIGTDAAEFYVGGPQIRALTKRQLEEMGNADPGNVKIDTGTIHAFEEGSVGWAAMTVVFSVSGELVVEVRHTVVVHREDDSWKIVQQHTSVGAPNQEVMGFEVTTSIDDIAEMVDRERPQLESVASPEGTVTIMFTDLESSTAMNESMGDDAYLPLLLKHNEIVVDQTREAGGSVVKSQGDGYMLAFPSARRAVGCAIAIQRDIAALDDRLKVRMGLHTGEAVRHGDDFYGRDVAYAARIGSAASGGEILTSSLVKSLVEPSGSVSFEQPRELELKGFDGRQTVFAVDW